ncbi:MAG TPA: nucleotidyltransferase family protein [Vicinamibacteria bacterium]|nr:nucleotidyltransferase family protein [Vicinamibacteria bacterium]
MARDRESRQPGTVAALILAAGESRRMGSPKPLLPLGDTSFLAGLLQQFLASRARPVLVVLGHQAERIRKEVSLEKAAVVVNAEYRRGMLSSIRAGLRELGREPVSGALLCPVDHPCVSAAVVDLLISRFEETRSPIIVPVHGGQRGHPVLFASSLFQEIREAPDSVGARQVVWDHADQVLEIPIEDPGIITDIDTPEQYQRLIGS